jgi:hypothetical protein
MAPSTIRTRLDSMRWTSAEEAEYEGLSFYFEPAFGAAPPPGKVFVFKPRRFFERYADVLAGVPTKKILELGIWLGGSAVIHAMLLDVEKLVCIDLSKPIPSFEKLRAEHPVGRRIRAYYETNQGDEEKLHAILDKEFDGPPDVIFDDASHLYGPSRASFEILYPRLRPGGWYVIEDWAWAHLPLAIWPEEPSLAGLIFELQLVMCSNPDKIEDIIVKRDMVLIRKPESAPVSRERLSLESLYVRHHRTRPLMTPE